MRSEDPGPEQHDPKHHVQQQKRDFIVDLTSLLHVECTLVPYTHTLD